MCYKFNRVAILYSFKPMKSLVIDNGLIVTYNPIVLLDNKVVDRREHYDTGIVWIFNFINNSGGLE